MPPIDHRRLDAWLESEPAPRPSLLARLDVWAGVRVLWLLTWGRAVVRLLAAAWRVRRLTKQVARLAAKQPPAITPDATDA